MPVTSKGTLTFSLDPRLIPFGLRISPRGLLGDVYIHFRLAPVVWGRQVFHGHIVLLATGAADLATAAARAHIRLARHQTVECAVIATRHRLAGIAKL